MQKLKEGCGGEGRRRLRGPKVWGQRFQQGSRLAEKETGPSARWCPSLLSLWESWGAKGLFSPELLGHRAQPPTDLHSLSFKAEASLQSLPLPGLCLCPHTVPTSPTLPPWVAQAQTGSLSEPGGSKQRRHQSLGDPWSPSGRARGPGPRAPVCHLGSDKGVGARVPQSPGQGLPHGEKINVCQIRVKYSFQVVNTSPDSNNLGLI